jgi:hypothetical protein
MNRHSLVSVNTNEVVESSLLLGLALDPILTVECVGSEKPGCILFALVWISCSLWETSECTR